MVRWLRYCSVFKKRGRVWNAPTRRFWTNQIIFLFFISLIYHGCVDLVTCCVWSSSSCPCLSPLVYTTFNEYPILQTDGDDRNRTQQSIVDQLHNTAIAEFGYCNSLLSPCSPEIVAFSFPFTCPWKCSQIPVAPLMEFIKPEGQVPSRKESH